MWSEGSTVSGTSYSGHEHPSLPKPAPGPRPSHRPWCLHCKRHHDADDLDDDQLCVKCARAAASRAAAAERRAREAQAQREAAKRQEAAQRAAQQAPTPTDTSPAHPQTPAPELRAHSAAQGAGEAPVRAKVTQSSSPNGILIALHGDNITHRQAEVAALLHDLLAGLNTSAPAPAASPPPRRTPPRRTPTRRSSVDEQAIIRDYQGGDTAPQIAARRGHTPATIRRVLDRNNIPRRDDRTRNTNQHARITPDPETLAETKRLYLDDQLSIEDIAHRYGIHRRVIARILTDAGVTIRPAAHLRGTDLDPADVIARYRAGTSIVDIARHYHAKTNRVRKVLVDHGVQIRAKGGSPNLAARLQALGVTASHVKHWAHDQGLIDRVTPGLVAGHLIDAYENAHPQLSSSTNHTGATA